MNVSIHIFSQPFLPLYVLFINMRKSAQLQFVYLSNAIKEKYIFLNF